MNTEQTANRRQLAVWLLVCCALVFAMVVLGGATRLTGSGLSMVTWEPVSGVVPPLDRESWEAEFKRYQTSPEFQKINADMTLEEFKRIFWFEYSHRLLGRSVGVVFLLPFLYFLLRRKIEKSLIPKLITMFVLGGLQGLLGWYMVKSGLVDKPHVSQYRLTAHLAAAAVIYGYMLWVAMDLLFPHAGSRSHAGRELVQRFALSVTALIAIVMVSGGFVAGLKAGLVYNTFPLMGDRWIPAEIFVQEPVYRNFFENVATVQFNHRVLAIVVFVAVFALWLTARRFPLAPPARLGIHLLAGMAIVQVTLGISTLLWHVPVVVAVSHQGGAFVLLAIALFVNHELRR